MSSIYKEMVNDLDTVRMGIKLLYLVRTHKEWSDKTFGLPSERGPIGPLKHLAKEVNECLANPADLMEYADCLLLILDASHRQGLSAEQLIDLAIEKVHINEKRQWNVGDVNSPAEHVRNDS